ncbi:MAG: HU family DNA-binding protein [bacterium]|nr:HU family DNA-binding protein [bacterium]
MTKRDLVVGVATEMGLTQSVVKRVIESTLQEIVDSLCRGEKVELRDFGVFKVKKRKERIARNPKTGEEVPIKARRVAYFKPGKLLKDKIENS